jgi:hypothetical protein
VNSCCGVTGSRATHVAIRSQSFAQIPNYQRAINGCYEDIFRAISRGDRVFAGGVMSGRSSIAICAAAAFLALGIGTDLQATTRPINCLAAPNASSPHGQRWYYHVDLLNNRKCWHLRAPVAHGAAKAPEFHALFTAANTPVPGSRMDSAPRLHNRKLSSKPQPTSFVSTKPIRQSDARIPQQTQGSTPQVDESTDAVAASGSAAAKPIEQSDAASVTQQPQESTLTKSADAVAASPPAAAKPIEQSDAASVTQQPQESTLSKPADTAAASSAAAAKPIEQSDAASVTQQPQQSTLSKPADAVAVSSAAAAKPTEQSDAASVTPLKQQQGSALSNPTQAVTASPAAISMLRVADANLSASHADPEPLDGGGRVTERNKPRAEIVPALSFQPVQMFLLLVLAAAIVVFLISLVIILHHRVTALIDLQLDRDQPEAQAPHGLRDDGARRAQMFVDDEHIQMGIDAPPPRLRHSAARAQNRTAIATEPPPKSSFDEVAQDFRAELIYLERDAIQNGSRQGRSG